MSPAASPRRLSFDLRVSWKPPQSGAGSEVSVVREVRTINGRPATGHDAAECLDPKPVSPEPLGMLLPARLRESEFTAAGEGRVGDRRAVMLDYRGVATLPADIRWTGECVTVSLPGRSRGRIWVDAETYDVLRVDDRLVGTFRFDVPREHVRRWASSEMVVERAESSTRYQRVKFEDPEESLMLPATIDTVTVIRGAARQRVRISQRFTGHRRFLTDGRLIY